MSLKFKLKSYFKTRDTSEYAVEFMRMFILPFAKQWNPDASLDSAINAFFGTKYRKSYEGTACRDFRMPGEYMKAGARPAVRSPDGARQVIRGQRMIIIADSKSGQIRIDVKVKEKYYTFRLTRAELEFIKDYVDVRET